MASTASVASNAPPASSISTNAQPNGAARTTTKPPPVTSMKPSDGGRKQTASPGEASYNKRGNAPKAWTSALNPITQKPISQPQQNGNISQQQPAVPLKVANTENRRSSDSQAHDRLIFILAASTGQYISLSTSSGEQFEGVLCGSVFEGGEANIMTKMTKRIFSTTDAKINGFIDQGSSFAGLGPDFAMTFETTDIAEISLPSLDMAGSVKPQDTTSAGFRTDAEISRATEQAERPLQPWIPESSDGVEQSLDSAGFAGWDQFETNKRLFGTNSTFDEHHYTTRIDRSAPSYKERERQAARLAKEIEGTSSTNAHLREERGQTLENDGEDEEDKYSGVKRDDHNFPPLQSGQMNKYTPPARRAPTGQATVAGAPVDPAIISAQVSRPESIKSPHSKAQHAKDTDVIRIEASAQPPKREPSPAVNPEPIIRPENRATVSRTPAGSTGQDQETSAKTGASANHVSSPRNGGENATEDVENKLLHHFKAFAASEKMRVHQSQRTRATNDRQAKLRELQTFSRSFKLRTPVPTDLVGILAKDPTKQEQIVEKARKEHRDVPAVVKSAPYPPPGNEGKAAAKMPAVPKFDPSMVPGPIPDRQTLVRNRAGHPASTTRADRQGPPSAPHTARGGPGFAVHRTGGLPPDRRPEAAQSIPTPIPIHEGRLPPRGPSAEQSGLPSPQRSSVHTPTSAMSTKFNVKASEFRPNATAPAFAPSGPSIGPSSPQPIDQARAASGMASPSSFFGAKKPKPGVERPTLTNFFNPFPRMKAEIEQQKEQTKKAYSGNGGIPPAYNTPPRWEVPEENQERTYKDVFDKLFAVAASPAASARSVPAQNLPYQQQIPYHLQNSMHHVPQVHPPHHAMQHSPSQNQYNGAYEDSHHRGGHMTGSPHVYPSPRLGPTQMVYPPSIAPGVPMQYAHPGAQYIPAPGGPSPMHVRGYPGAPQFTHGQPPQMGATMMSHQPSNGPYMGMPQQQYPQHLPIYSASPAAAYPQLAMSQPHAGYPSPGRAAPMMMHQGSQQGHHNGQHPYAPTGQPVPMGYGQYGQGGMRGGHPAPHNQYGTSPGPAYHHPAPPQRATSGGYGGGYQGKVPMQPMPSGQGPSAMNGTVQQGGYPPQDGPMEMTK